MDDVYLADLALLILALIAGIAAVRVRDLLSATILLGIYSLLMALVWADLFAMDVAFTEAAVGAGVSTILLLGALTVVGTREKPSRGAHLPAIVIVCATGGALIYGTLDMPSFGDPAAPVHGHVAPEYIAQDVGKAHAGGPGPESGHGGGHGGEHGDGHDDGHGHDGDFGHHVPNLVTAVLADYRGYDTMFETAVIFTAGICLVLLLRGPRPGGGSAT